MKRLFALLLSVMAFALVAVPVGAQDEAPTEDAPEAVATASGPSRIVVHQVDARGEVTTASVIADSYDVDAADVTLTQNGEALALSAVTTARNSRTAQEIVFVVDANSSLSAGGVFENATDQLAASIAELPPGTTVSVVSAGLVATTVVQPTTNLKSAARAVENMVQSRSTSLFEAVNVAGSLFSDDNATYKTVLVFSGSVDPIVSIDPLIAAQSMIDERAQLVAFRYQAGDDRLNNIIDVVGGLTVGTSDPQAVAASMADAVAAASDRLVVNFAGVDDAAMRGDAVLQVGTATVDFSYPGQRLTATLAGLTPLANSASGGLGPLQSQMGLYIVVAVAMIGVGLAVYSVGSIFASGDQSLEGMISRYSGETDGTLDDEESAIVQTALIKRAVEMSETFAEDRGFLAKIESLLERARLPLRPGEAMSIYVAGIFFSGAGGFIMSGGFIGSLVFAGVASFAQIAGVQFVAKRRIKKFEAQLPDTLQLLAGTLRAGYSLPQGLEAVSHEIVDPMGFELRRAMTEARLGRELEDALGGIADRLESADFAWVVMAIGIQREVGGNLNELLMTVSDTMVARERLKGEVAALTAEGKMSAIMLGGMPPVLGLVMWVMNKAYMNQLFITTMGNILLGLAVVSSLVGFVWMKKVITVNV